MPGGGDVFCWNRGCFLLEPACVFAASSKPMVFWFLAEIFLRGGGGHGGPSGRRRRVKAVTHGDASTTVVASWNRLAGELQSYDRSMG